MPLHKIRDFHPDYRKYFDDQDILGFDLYSGNEKVGSIDDLLVDDQGKFRYFVINTGAWIFGKKVLLPVGRSRTSFSDRRVYVDGLTRTQANDLPEYKEDMAVDYDQEEQVRGVYRPRVANAPLERSAPLNTAATTNAPLEQSAPLNTAPTAYNRGTYDRSTYSYDRDPDLYNLNEQNHQNLRLYEERLVANKDRHKTGEVKVGKHVETESARVSVPIEKERVVIERSTPTDAGTALSPDAGAFNEGEVARIEVYEETPDIHKEAFVREEVRVRKEVDRETIEAEETLRKERLDINKDGNPMVEGPDRR
ncbi:MAG: DUF2382 domain-containing protein [Leptolyngbyaceae cyanobacterium RU_5_1]|nr:DUF2382 domain-containing protein [Leptolyngbyaceae cyanobacterium RU_5_1]